MKENKIILFISRDVTQKKDGGTLVSKRNERLLIRLGYSVKRFVVPQPSLITRVQNFIFTQSYGETKSIKKDYVAELKKDYDFVFFDSSTYGGFVKLAKEFGKKTICFYHNVELTYYEQKAKITKNWLDKLIISYIRFNESLSSKLADILITLTNRDSTALQEIYNRKADLIMPTSFESRDLDSLYKRYQRECSPYLLFVGTNFFANVEGIQHFIEALAPHIKMTVLIVGNIKSAFEGVRDIPDNIKFLGQVESLDELYVNATAVIAPILSGSGLKTKTAEAFSYGKTIIGFEEAFAGIDLSNFPEAGKLVKNDQEFIKAIESLDENKILNQKSVDLFNTQLSDDIYLSSLSNVINNFSKTT